MMSAPASAAESAGKLLEDEAGRRIPADYSAAGATGNRPVLTHGSHRGH